MNKILRFLFLLSGMLFTSQHLMAYDFMKDDNKYVFRGMGSTVSIELPIYDKDGRDMWVIDGYVYVKADGKSEVTVLHYKSEGDISDSKKTNSAKFDTSISGVLKIKDTSGSWVRLSNTQQTIDIYSSNDNFTAVLEWEPPYEWRGMDLEFRIKVHGDKNASKEWNQEWIKNVGALTAPPKEVKPNIMNSMLSTEGGSPRQTNVMWQIAAGEVKKAVAHYKVNGTEQTAILANETFGTIPVPSYQLVNDLYVEVDYIDNEGNRTNGHESTRYDVPYFHQAKNLQTVLANDGNVHLSWEVDNKDRTDIMQTDYWIIQRNTQGSNRSDHEGWATIGQVPYKQGEQGYGFDDATLLSVYADTTVYYRVQRASVTGSWGYSTLSGTAVGLLLSRLALPDVHSLTVTKTDNWDKNGTHPVTVSWTADKNTGGIDANTLFLRDVNDWEELCVLVSKGYNTINAVMTRDIDISASDLMLGDEGNPFCGTFDGGGYKLTVNYDSEDEATAPFSYVRGTTIKNLHVAGTVKGGIHSSGMIGNGSGTATNTIESCRVSASITFSGRGNTTPHGGGFVGHGRNALLNISNSLFDGKLIATSQSGSYAGVFIGWGDVKGNVLKNNLDRATFQNVANKAFCYRYINKSNESYGNSSDGSSENYSINNLPSTIAVGSRSAEEMAQALGSAWTVRDELCVPKMEATHYDQQAVYVWDGNAQMKLYVDKYVDGTLRYTDERLLSTAEHEAGTLEIDLPTSCVDYVFRLSVDRQGSPIHIGSRERNIQTNTVNFPVSHVEQPTVSGDTIALASREDWEAFVAQVAQYNDADMKSYNVVMTRDIDLGNSQAAIGDISSSGYTKFRGSFDGRGHTLTVHYNITSAPFCFVEDATIKNLHVAGSITSLYFVAGVADQAVNSTIENCRVSAQLNVMLSGQGTIDPILGGIVRKAERGKVVVRNCIFDGYFTYPGTIATASGMVGILSRNATVEIVNCVYNPLNPSSTQNGATMILSYQGYSSVQITNSYYTSPMNTLQGTDASSYTTKQLLEALGESWSFYKGGFYPWEKKEEHSLFYFDNNVKLDSLVTTQQHSSVQLKWYTNGGNADYYEVHRRDLGVKNSFVVIATDVQQNTYIDQTAKAHHEYEYMVKSFVQCEGLHTDSVTAKGQCDNFGRISGFVRMANGIGIGGAEVKAVPDASLSGVGKVKSVVTDETGYFLIDSLAYLPNNGLYTVMVSVTGDGPDYTDAICNFTEDKNEFTNTVLALREYYVFTGKVLYDGTSIPVPGAQFRMDGNPLYNYRQERVETGNDGAFSISVPAGPHRIQVEKEGHVFENDGYFIDIDNKEDSTQHNWQRNIADVYLWDQTRVTLRGRIVGGEVQGQKPLGQSLSYNNLGRNLKMVMQLEGDNTSWIVRDPLNLSVTERRDSLQHGAIDPLTRQPKDITRWEMTRHSITVHPDVKSGEYELKLFPVKYRVIELSCTGYSTLFQQGKVGETLDLTNVSMDSIAEFKCIYHSPVKLAVDQFNISGEKFFGDNFYLAQDIDNSVDTVAIWTAKTDSTAEKYALGHPVFMAGGAYLFNLQAQEEYLFENRTDTVADVVPLHEGTVYFHNDLVGNNVTDSVQLDSVGHGYYQFIPKNTTFLGNDESSLRTLDINLLYDGVYYDVRPFNDNVLRAYVMGIVPAANGRQVVSKGGTHLIDILRDPPGAGSSAYIESGSKFKYAYTLSLDGKIGLSIEHTTGTGTNFYQGIWGGTGAGTAVGTITNAKTTSDWAFNFSVRGGGTFAYSYEMTTTERIQTSSATKWVGPKADIYIGMTDNIIVGDAVAVRMVPESQMEKLRLRTNGKIQLDGHKYDIKDGTVQVLATGTDASGEKVYLISDEVYNYYAEFNSEFMHTGAYIETELIPNLLKMRNERLLPKGTDPQEAQAMADRDSRNVYISLVDADDTEFGYHASLAKDKKAKYTIVRPTGITVNIDEIEQYNREVITWAGFIAQNEREKVQAAYNADLVKNIDFDGAANVQYSESFTTAEDYSRYLRFEPFSLSLNTLPDKVLSNTLTEAVTATGDDSNGNVEVIIEAGTGASVHLKFKPVFTFDTDDKNSKSESWSKKTGFTLSASNKSNLSVSVYRTKVRKSDIEKDVENGNADVFLEYSNSTLDKIHDGVAGANWTTYASSDEQLYGNFIFVTNGGATCAPWEDERKTKFFQPGTVHDQKTVRIDQLRIWAEQSIVSNVPYGEPARFTIYLCNESPTPDKASPTFTIVAPDEMNQHGARIMFGGNALNGTGYTVALPPGQVIAKEIEVYAGSDFDYNDLGIQLYDINDLPQAKTVKLSAHFVPTAGNIAISTPGDKWVINTESPYDNAERGYYMPVRIEGFNVNQHNFDHIELQYKLSTQGEKDWVNICSYYKSDSLMALANGTCKIIENDGYIMSSFFGEKDPIEQYYDLRAVVYCRNGNGFLTASSPILTGVKDTRRPVPFGTPKPVNGILGIGDDITIAFSEPIAGNYLSEVNNFEVLGYANSSNITQGTCLRADGITVGITSAVRNFAARDFSLDVMVNPDTHDKPMALFRHGDAQDFFEAGLAADNRLLVVINGVTYYSDRPVEFSGLHQICYVFKTDLEKEKTTIAFYDGNTYIGGGTYNAIYSGSTRLQVGGKTYVEEWPGTEEIEGYRGALLEFRIWNKALTESDIKQYSKKRLTGYELGLLDNYALNEGKGDISYDKTVSGADLELIMPVWSLPAGLSAKLDGVRGFVMNDSAFVRTASQDYTLMFWYKADAADGTLLSNGPALLEPQSKNHFNIGLRDGSLFFRSGNMEVSSEGHYLPVGSWHHVAVTVNRSRNVGNLYIDQNLINTFAVDTLGGILGGTLAAGITYDDAYTTSNPIVGNIDEVALYEMSLPINVIKDYASTTPSGRELGTLVYLPFSRSETQKDNQQRLVASGLSIKQSRDNQGNYSTRMDAIVADSVMQRVTDREIYAPIDNSGQRENLNYSYVADKQNLLINIDEPDANIEKTHLYITVRDVADLNGNLMESPVMMDLYVYRNPLRWADKRINIEMAYGSEHSVDVKIQNLSGKAHTYYLDNSPIWITPSKTSGTIAATDEETITLTISPYINIGDFDEVINLVSEEGLNEPLPIHIKVRGEAPQWEVSETLRKSNIAMNIVARVKINGVVTNDPDDLIGVFGDNHETLGVAHLRVDNTADANEALAFVTVYNHNSERRPLLFEYYDASTGRISVLQPDDYEQIVFVVDTIMGTTTDPVAFSNSNEEVQTIRLNKGWNWVSFYLDAGKTTINNLLNRATAWELGDAIEMMGSNGFYEISYKAIPDQYNPTRINYFWDRGNDSITVDATKMYRIHSGSDKQAYFTGMYSYERIQVNPGWNRIAYVSRLNLPIAAALSDYTANAAEGDIIKSQSEFAVLTEDAGGNKAWKGTLTHLTTGHGYMLKHLGNDTVRFFYPLYNTGSRYGNTVNRAPKFQNTTGSSMNIIARVSGVELEQGDCLLIYNGAELCGKTEMGADSLFFLSVAESAGNRLTFAIERPQAGVQENGEEGSELIAVSSQYVSYTTDAVMGTPDQPTIISFAPVSRYADGQWYDLQGRKLSKRPQRAGVYIYNGQKTIIE